MPLLDNVSELLRSDLAFRRIKISSLFALSPYPPPPPSEHGLLWPLLEWKVSSVRSEMACVQGDRGARFQ
jgi:hypothetical protein